MSSNSFGKGFKSRSAYVSSRISSPISARRSRRSSIFAMKSVGSLPARIAMEKSFSRRARMASFVFPSRNSITQAALFRALVRPHGDIRRTFSQKEQDRINVVVCRLPGSHSIRVGLLRARCSVKDFMHFPRIQTEGLAYFSPPLAVIGRTFAFTDGAKSPI